MFRGMSVTLPAAALCAAGLLAFSGCSPADPDDPVEDTGEPMGSESCDEHGLVDWDGDGIADEDEGNGDFDRDGIPNRLDTDSDGDGRLDADEAVRADCREAPYDSDEDGAPNYLDLDSDDNGIPDAEDGDGDTNSDGVPDWRDVDDDGDRIPDSVELGEDPYDPPDVDADGTPDYHDTDSDGDEIDDMTEGTDDVDADGLANYRDLDSDGDGIDDEREGTGDCDGDGLGNWIDIDSNGDGIPDWEPEVVHEGACPPCSPDCESTGDIEPDADDEGAEGVVPNPDGPGIVIGSESTDAGFAWVANSEESWPTGGGGTGTVSKIDLETGDEVGRFLVGLPSQSNSPSRTAVDGNGDAYIACRSFGSQGTVVKIAANLEDCVDRDRNGRIDTSSDSIPLAYGEDECILWTSEVGSPGGTPRALAVDLGGLDSSAGLPWVGLHDERRILQLDPDDGSELASVPLGTSPYGAAIDSLGSIWISGFFESNIQRVDSVTFTTDPPIMVGGGGCSGPYGIATDNRDRVWIGTFGNSACRYDPSDGSFFNVPFPDGGVMSRGVAVDGFDTVWVAAHGSMGPTGHDGWFFGFNADDGLDMRQVSTAGNTPVGVAIDSLGYIWAVNQSSNNASRLDPITDEVHTFPVGNGPYTYSDFTGFQRARVFASGAWSTEFEACAERGTDTDWSVEWGNLVWSVHTPGSTSIEFIARSADTEADLDIAADVTLAAIPGSVSPVDIEDAFIDAGVAMGWYLRITVLLSSSGGSESPVFEDLEVSWSCDDGGVE